jgi:acyl carrier protein
MLDKIREVITGQVDIEADKIVPEAAFMADLGIDSLDLFELVMALEDEFGVEIPSEELENIVTVQNLMDYLKDVQ